MLPCSLPSVACLRSWQRRDASTCGCSSKRHQHADAAPRCITCRCINIQAGSARMQAINLQVEMKARTAVQNKHALGPNLNHININPYKNIHDHSMLATTQWGALTSVQQASALVAKASLHCRLHQHSALVPCRQPAIKAVSATMQTINMRST